MSRRREEAELQRVLQLSTQQARTFAALPPYTLSSAPTDDSRDMELRPAIPLSAGEAVLSTPHRHGPGRSSYLLSPDPEERDYSPPPLPQTRVEVVLPIRPTRRLSPDPIDSFNPELSVYRDIHYSSTGDIPEEYSFAPISASGAVGADDALLGPSSSASTGATSAVGHVPSSGGTDSSRRSSARQQTAKEKKATAAAERKRKRAELKAQEAAAAATASASGDAPSSSTAAPAPKRRTKKVKLDQTGAGGLESAARPTPPQHGLEEAAMHLTSSSSDAHGHEYVVAPRATAACTTAGPTSVSAEPEACGGARESLVGSSNTPVGVISSVGQEFASQHSSPSKTNPGSPVRSSPGAVGKDSSSPTAAVTPNVSRVLRPSHDTPPTSTATPNGGRWRTPRNDLAGVLAKFPKARRTGMSKRLNIVPLHASIGPGVKALPPPPPKSKKKVESDDDDDEEDENGNPKIKVGSREWLMMED